MSPPGCPLAGLARRRALAPFRRLRGQRPPAFAHHPHSPPCTCRRTRCWQGQQHQNPTTAPHHSCFLVRAAAARPHQVPASFLLFCSLATPIPLRYNNFAPQISSAPAQIRAAVRSEETFTAVTKKSLLGLRASGPLGADLTFSTHGKQVRVSRRSIPSNPQTPAQVSHRTIFQTGIECWHTLTDAEKESYAAINPRIGANPGYLNFMSLWLMGIVPIHHTRHEDGGADEISIAALSGDPADTINKSLLTAQGDIIQRGAAIPQRLAIGILRHFLRVNEAANALEYVKGYEFGKAIRMWQWELDFFHWTTTVVGSGAIEIQGYGLLQISSGATAGGTARGRGYMFGWFPYNTLDFQWYAQYTHADDTPNGQCWLKVDVDTAADPADRSVGWRIDGDALKGIVHNGAALTVVDLGIALSPGEMPQLFLDFVHGDKVYWYVDSVEKGNSDQIPTATRENDVYPIFAVANGIDNAAQRAQLRRHGWIHG